MGKKEKKLNWEALSPDDQMKYEIASEKGVQLGADATARQNGSVGGEITKRLVEMGMNKSKNSSSKSNNSSSK